jgi:hydrogenase expression/formation protein HypC
MCLAIPGKVISIEGDRAKVDFGGVRREVNVSFVEASIGDYVIVHAGFAIEILDQEEAEKTLEMIREIASYG